MGGEDLSKEKAQVRKDRKEVQAPGNEKLIEACLLREMGRDGMKKYKGDVLGKEEKQ